MDVYQQRNLKDMEDAEQSKEEHYVVQGGHLGTLMGVDPDF
jgi:hypothetical protein